MQVSEIMSSKIEWIDVDTPIQEVARKMRSLDVGCLPVRGRGDSKLVGMITDRDIACRVVAEGRSPSTTKVQDVMSTNPAYCFDDQDVTDAAHVMEDRQLHRLAVLNRKNDMVGMLSLADVALHAPHELAGEVIEAISQPAQSRFQEANLT